MPLDLTKPVQTRSGHPVRILITDAALPRGETIVGLIKEAGSGFEHLRSWHRDGKYVRGHTPYNDDLINVPETVTETLNLARGRIITVRRLADEDAVDVTFFHPSLGTDGFGLSNQETKLLALLLLKVAK